jgi:hypothetical protein
MITWLLNKWKERQRRKAKEREREWRLLGKVRPARKTRRSRLVSDVPNVAAPPPVSGDYLLTSPAFASVPGNIWYSSLGPN